MQVLGNVAKPIVKKDGQKQRLVLLRCLRSVWNGKRVQQQVATISRQDNPCLQILARIASSTDSPLLPH